MKIVLASGNSGKLREISAALAGCGAELTPQSEFGVQPAPEPHPTFLENALAKARHAALQTGLPALADDSGIAVCKLGGIPGVRSARFAGENPSDEQNNQKLLAALRQFPSPQDRRAFYCAVTILVLSPQDPAPLVAEGFWHGVITQEPRGRKRLRIRPRFSGRKRRQNRRRNVRCREGKGLPPRTGAPRPRPQNENARILPARMTPPTPPIPPTHPTLPASPAESGGVQFPAPNPPPLTLYVHLPWCVRKCPYCDFNSHRAPKVLPEKE